MLAIVIKIRYNLAEEWLFVLLVACMISYALVFDKNYSLIFCEYMTCFGWDMEMCYLVLFSVTQKPKNRPFSNLNMIIIKENYKLSGKLNILKDNENMILMYKKYNVDL